MDHHAGQSTLEALHLGPGGQKGRTVYVYLCIIACEVHTTITPTNSWGNRGSAKLFNWPKDAEEGLKFTWIPGLEHRAWDSGNGGLLDPAYLPVSPRRQASLVGQPQLQVDLAFPLGSLRAVSQLSHHLSKVPLIFFHSSVGLYARDQVQWHLVRPRDQGTRPPLPLPFAFGVSGLA